MSYRSDDLVCLSPVPSDIEIAQSVNPIPIKEIAKKMQIGKDYVYQYGKYQAKIDLAVYDAVKSKPNGHYICVAGVTPTPLGEGKTTVTIGLCQALGRHLQKKAITCIRQPSMGPTFGIKGGAAGGGYSQIIPMENFNLHLTGDIHAVSIANNLLAAAIDTRIFHEATQKDDALFNRLIPRNPKTKERIMSKSIKYRMNKLGIDPNMNPDEMTNEQKRKLVRLDIDPNTIQIRRVVDVNDRFLREISIGEGPNEKMPRKTGFDIAVASEIMAILALSVSLEDMRNKLGKIVFASNKDGEPLTAEDLGVSGALAALLKDAIMPNLMQTLEGTPAFVHAGPFANIAHGNSSIIADKLALKLVEEDGYVVTEAGFGADIGFEKFCNIKCRYSGIKPDCVIIVTTIRALKMHGGGSPVIAGKPLDIHYVEEDLKLVDLGCDNMQAHINLAKKFNVNVLVCINVQTTDTKNEINLVCEKAKNAGAVAVATSTHWAEGGRGAINLAREVIKVCKMKQTNFEFLYPLSFSIKEKIDVICRMIYGAKGVDYSNDANESIQRFELQNFNTLPICMAKTQYSISHDPNCKNVPVDFILPIKEVRVAAGAGFIYPICGPIVTMPGLPTRPIFYDIDIDTKTGQVIGLY